MEVKKIIIAGNPNVGKSVIFNALTGSYATVSNYPGTTVEVFRGNAKIGGAEYEVIDTPGMYSFVPVTDEERVSRNIIFSETPYVLIHVLDAKNIERMLPFTLQLIEADLPVILVLNIMDEAERLGIKIDTKILEAELGVPVLTAIGTMGQGLSNLKDKIANYKKGESKRDIVKYDSRMEEFLIKSGFGRINSLLLLQEDTEVAERLLKENKTAAKNAEKEIEVLKKKYSKPLGYLIAMERQSRASAIIDIARVSKGKQMGSFAEWLSRLTMSTFWGFLILAFVLYFGLYLFVGKLGAGVVVDFINTTVFDKWIIPPVTNFIEHAIPWGPGQDLFVHEYGIVTLGLRYAFAIILPIVVTFFFVFAIIEDTGYLPRLAMLIDRVFKKMGLSGRAVIPMVLGLGCGTMATMVTRTLATKRERLIATLLLALAIPCSAQLGVIMAMLSGLPVILGIWLVVINVVFITAGFLAAKILPGEAPVFFMEVPPLRLPKLSNLFVKTYTRMEWYIKEVIPVFLIVSVAMVAAYHTHLLALLIKIAKYPLGFMGLPESTATIFIMGFFRRDYGAAGLFDMQKSGLLTNNQILVSIVVMTLFLPCIAQLIMMIKERKFGTAMALTGVVTVVSISAGFVINQLLILFKITL
ncbi:MAG: ferrous iron transport protein B [Candidatus Firestonebacteria bacterium RIFOXYA2_FULL_40_8]|nr:MAG: ferrous iron transport protein B [Candidatus Firestonebacteria bacterium RIFOXYA2_FULL_40_8]